MAKRYATVGLMILVWLSLALTVSALGQAFGRTNITNVRGVRANIWVPSPPNGLVWTASPVGICNSTSCGSSSKFVETGFIKGTAFGLNNQIRQYVTWRQPDGTVGSNFFVGSALSSNTWYQFKVLHSNSANRWEAWRGSSIPWYHAGLGWSTGQQTAIGAEAVNDGDWMDVYVHNPEYLVGTGSWTLFNYGYAQTTSHGCVYRVYTYGHRGYNC